MARILTSVRWERPGAEAETLGEKQVRVFLPKQYKSSRRQMARGEKWAIFFGNRGAVNAVKMNKNMRFGNAKVPVAVVWASAFAIIMTGCPENRPSGPPPSESSPIADPTATPPSTNHAQNRAPDSADSENPLPAAPTGKIGPMVTDLLPFIPARDVLGTPAVAPGGTLVVADAHTKHLYRVLGDWSAWQHARPSAANSGGNPAVFALTVMPMEFYVVVAAEQSQIVALNRLEPTFVTLFGGAQRVGWFGPLRHPHARVLFDLPAEHRPDDVRAIAIEQSRHGGAVIGTRFAYVCGRDLVVADVRAGTPTAATVAGNVAAASAAATFVRIATFENEPPIALAFANGEIDAVWPTGAMQRYREPIDTAGAPSASSATVGPDGETLLLEWEWTRSDGADEKWRIDERLRQAGIVGIGEFPATHGAPARPMIAVTTGTQIGPTWFATGHVAPLPGGMTATLNDGVVRILAPTANGADDTGAVVAEWSGFPTEVDFFGADPAGRTVSAISGRTVYVVALDLARIRAEMPTTPND